MRRARSPTRPYLDITKQFAKWLFTHINVFDYGFYSNVDKHPLPALDRDRWARMRNTKGAYWSIYKLTRPKLDAHMRRERILYYRSDMGKTMLLKLDIDGKGEGCTTAGAIEMAKYICRSIHRNAYWEMSTFGSGTHVYLLVERGKRSCRWWKEMLRHYSRSMREVTRKTGIEAKFDRVCGNPTIPSKKDGKWEIADGDCGILAKIPYLPNGEDSLRELMTAPMFTEKSFLKLIRKNEREHTAGQQPTTSHLTMRTSRDSTPSHQSLDLDTPDALLRTHKCYTGFCLHYDRKPASADELVDFYEQRGLHSGVGNSDRQKRLLRAIDVIAFRSTSEMPSRKVGGAFVMSKYVELIEGHVLPEHTTAAKCDRSVSDEDLAIGLYVMEQKAFVVNERRFRQFTCGIDVIVESFRNLREFGVITRGCNRNKAAAIRKILVSSGLIECLSAGYRATGKETGVCRKYGIGKAHPIRARFEEFKKTIPETARVPQVELKPSAPLWESSSTWFDEPVMSSSPRETYEWIPLERLVPEEDEPFVCKISFEL